MDGPGHREEANWLLAASKLAAPPWRKGDVTPGSTVSVRRAILRLQSSGAFSSVSPSTRKGRTISKTVRLWRPRSWVSWALPAACTGPAFLRANRCLRHAPAGHLPRIGVALPGPAGDRDVAVGGRLPLPGGGQRTRPAGRQGVFGPQPVRACTHADPPRPGRRPEPPG